MEPNRSKINISVQVILISTFSSKMSVKFWLKKELLYKMELSFKPFFKSEIFWSKKKKQSSRKFKALSSNHKSILCKSTEQ